MPLHKKNESNDQLEDADLTDELLEWAEARRAAVSETIPSGIVTAAPVKPKQGPKVLVVTLEESAADGAQAHLFDDIEGASLFVEAKVDSGLDPDRIIVFQGTPVNFNVIHRPVVTIGESEQPPASS